MTWTKHFMTDVLHLHIPCPDCGSKDALTVYKDGHSFCFSCQKFSPGFIDNFPENNESKENLPIIPERHIPIHPVDGSRVGLPDRGIGPNACVAYGVSYLQDDPNNIHVYPYFNKDGHHVANKLRYKNEKGFWWQGDSATATLFGQQLFPPGSAKAITVVEGECDALAAFQMWGHKYPVVSVKNASSAEKDCINNYEYLNSFETIVLAFDRDSAHVNSRGDTFYPGQDAARKVAAKFPIGKVRVLTFRDHKDANDYLIANKAEQFKDEWWKAPSFTPAGLKIGKDMWDEVSTPKNYEAVAYPWAGLNHHTFGIRLSELVLITAPTGVGKTSIAKEIEHSLLNNTKAGIGLLHLEEPNMDTALGLMSITANKPLHIPDIRSQVTNEELRSYFDTTIANDRIIIWDHFGSNNIQEVLDKIRHMHALGAKYIIFDHLSIVVSDQSGDERKQLDEISTKLKTLCMELNIAVIAIIHQNRQGLIRGSAGPEQLSNIVIALDRDLEDSDPWRRNVVKLTVKKNRFCGRTGPACWLSYNEQTGRLEELSEENIRRYESGDTVNETWDHD